jgi:endonuclease-3
MTQKQRGIEAVRLLKEIYPEAVCALEHGGDPFKLIVMARLSAQCTDARVNIVSRELFSVLPNAEAMANAPVTQIEELIRSCGLYRMKAKDIKAMSGQLINDFGGRVPDTVEELLTLSGVGRKIANLIVGDLYGKPAIVTDTHCIRICGRLGFYEETLKDPHKIEKILVKVISSEEQSDFCHRIVQFGRDVCSARAPKCETCPIRELCEHGIASGKTK